jgi:hypothetical protein
MSLTFKNDDEAIKAQTKKSNLPWLISLLVIFVAVLSLGIFYFVIWGIHGVEGNVTVDQLGLAFSISAPIFAALLVIKLFILNNKFITARGKSAMTKIDLSGNGKISSTVITVKNENDVVLSSQEVSNTKIIDKGNLWLFKFRYDFWFYAPKKLSTEFDDEVEKLIRVQRK